MDLLGMGMLLVEAGAYSTARTHCQSGFMAFYTIAMVLQVLTVIRIFLSCVHFSRRVKPFYRWLKRCCLCLNIF